MPGNVYLVALTVHIYTHALGGDRSLTCFESTGA